MTSGRTRVAGFVLAVAMMAAGGHAAAWGQAVTASGAPGVLHVSRSSASYVTNIRYLKLWGTIDGKKVEMTAAYGFGRTWVVAPGDYPVRVTHDENMEKGISRTYDVEVMPGKHQTFELTGLAE